ncbi:hypothetical protein F4823DRAFT_563145 [Ustulina deusta]|nr:hypothetical protein F4823DRAFT_563145 [Ustulina deusta]
MASQTNPAPTTSPATGPQTEGVDTSLSPMQANTAVTTDGFKNENEIMQQQDDVIVAPTTSGDGAGAGENQQQQGQKQKTAKVSDQSQVDEPAEKAQQQQQQHGGATSKLRSVFSRSKKGSDEVEGQGKGEEESATKHKADAE